MSTPTPPTNLQQGYLTPPTTSDRPATALRADIPITRPIPFPLQLGPLRFRRRKLTPDEITRLALNKPTIRRLARRGGVRRINHSIYAETQKVIRNRIKDILRPAIALVEHSNRKTLTALDVVYALSVLGNPIYGVGTIVRGDEVKSNAAYMRNRRAENARRVEGRERGRGGEG